MTDRPIYGPPLDDVEFERLIDLTFKAFGAPASERTAYVERVHRDGQRLLREKGRIPAGLVDNCMRHNLTVVSLFKYISLLDLVKAGIIINCYIH